MEDTFARTLIETQQDRLRQSVMLHTGINLDELEWSFLLVSAMSGIMGREFVVGTQDLSFFIFDCPGRASVQLSTRRAEVILHNSPRLSAKRRSRIREFAENYGLVVVEMCD